MTAAATLITPLPALELYARLLRRAASGHGVEAVARWDDGSAAPLPVARWVAAPTESDLAIARMTRGRVLDAGCGPGRLLEALRECGRECLGLDIAPDAVALARRRGAARLGSIFGPEAGANWDSVLLLDGNLGIGGDPVRLLSRVRDLLAPGGRAHVELDATCTGRRVRIESGAHHSDWLPWARVCRGSIDSVAAGAGLRVVARSVVGGRAIAELAPP